MTTLQPNIIGIYIHSFIATELAYSLSYDLFSCVFHVYIHVEETESRLSWTLKKNDSRMSQHTEFQTKN